MKKGGWRGGVRGQEGWHQNSNGEDSVNLVGY